MHKDGPLLVVAGAGAGKTKTIAHRIAHLISTGVSPQNILAVTFTNKAAREMRDRVQNLLALGEAGTMPVRSLTKGGFAPGIVPALPLISTFHSLGVSILKNNAETLGISRYFSILDKNESLSIIKKITKELGISPKQFNPNGIQSVISREKNRLGTPERFGATNESGYFGEIVHSVWEKYEKKLAEEKSFDFDDLIQKPVFLFQQNEMIKNRYQNLWKYIHIDEYQDTNTAQYELSRLLAEGHGNICAVGDSDQAIYSWRQADFRNILNFERNFPGTKVVLLEENYRSTKVILEAANQVIKKNRQRKEKTLFTSRTDGEKIKLWSVEDESDEAEKVVEKIKEILQDVELPYGSSTSPDEIAVLYRANFQSRILEEKFLRANVAYQLLGTRFYERKEVKDVVAFLRYTINSDDLQSMERIVNIPPRGIGEVYFQKIANGYGHSLPSRVQGELRGFYYIISKIKETISREKLSDSIKFIIKNSRIEDELKRLGEDGEERIENLRELVTIASKYDFLKPEEAVEKFLTETSLVSDQDSLTKEKKGVKLMTVHASKGLEFKYVFVVGLEEGLFPHQRLNPEEENDPEEERRLFYVALTRAKDQLFLSYAKMRTIFGSKRANLPSSFLYDIDESLIETEQGQDDDSNKLGLLNDVEWESLK